jgi:hypothetical protein
MGYSLNHRSVGRKFHGRMKARKTATSAFSKDKVQTHLVLAAVSNNRLKLFN